MHTRSPRQIMHRFAGHMNSEHSGHFSTAGGHATCHSSGQLQRLGICWACLSGSHRLCTCRQATSSEIEQGLARLTLASYIPAMQEQQRDAVGPGDVCIWFCSHGALVCKVSLSWQGAEIRELPTDCMSQPEAVSASSRINMCPCSGQAARAHTWSSMSWAAQAH